MRLLGVRGCHLTARASDAHSLQLIRSIMLRSPPLFREVSLLEGIGLLALQENSNLKNHFRSSTITTNNAFPSQTHVPKVVGKNTGHTMEVLSSFRPSRHTTNAQTTRVKAKHAYTKPQLSLPRQTRKYGSKVRSGQGMLTQAAKTNYVDETTVLVCLGKPGRAKAPRKV